MTYAPSDLLGAMLSRAADATPPVTLEEIANGHMPQLELMQRASEMTPSKGFVHTHIIALCSRRAAKSTSIMALLAMDASAHDGVQIYFGRTKPAVRLSIWVKVWKPFCKKHGFKVVHNETSMVSTFASGGIVAFTGTDDVAHVESYLGNKLRRAVIDEAQAQPPSTLNPLIDRILPPALSDVGGQLIVAGTIPEVPAGTFYELWRTGTGWLKRNWSRFQNPHLGTIPEQMAKLAKFLVTSGRKITDALVRRDWFGEFVFETNATAYAYDQQRNGYTALEPAWLGPWLAKFEGDPAFAHIHRTITPDDGKARHGIMASVPFKGIEIYSVAVDPGAVDRFSVQVNGWGSGTEKVQQLFEFSSQRNAGLDWGHLGPIIELVDEVYGPNFRRYDGGGSKVVMKAFGMETGFDALLPATKGAGSLHGSVQQVSTLLRTARLQVMIGSALEEDFQKARWNPDARAKLQWKWASDWHPDPSESERYGLEDYFNMYVEPEEPEAVEVIERQKHEHNLKRRHAARLGHVLDEDMDAAIAAEEESMWD